MGLVIGRSDAATMPDLVGMSVSEGVDALGDARLYWASRSFLPLRSSNAARLFDAYRIRTQDPPPGTRFVQAEQIDSNTRRIRPVEFTSLEPRLDFAAIVRIVRRQGGPDASIDLLRLYANQLVLSAEHPEMGNGGPQEARRVGAVWFVRAHGRFVVNRPRPPSTSATASLVVQDKTGGVIAFGVP